jgi:hypothetical protein
MQTLSTHTAAGVPASTDTLRLALLLAFPVIALEQVVHTDTPVSTAWPVHEALHWLGDSLLALPLAAAAIWLGDRVASRHGLDAHKLPDVVARACLMALLFAVLLVPGALVHEQADRLSHPSRPPASHSHLSVSGLSSSAPSPLVSPGQLPHALGDGLVGQAIGLPVLVAALAWRSRRAPRGVPLAQGG